MKNELIEMIVLLNGNFVPFQIRASEREGFEKAIVDAIKKGTDAPYYYLVLGPMTVLVKNILGWYFRPKIEAPTDKMMKFLGKHLDQGEGWRDPGE